MASGIGKISSTVVFGAIVAVIGIVVGVRLPAAGALDLDVERNFEDFSVLFTNLAIIALLVERFIEIVWTAQRGPQKNKIKRELVAAESATPVVAADVKKWNEQLIDYRAMTERFALRTGFVIGVVLSLGGVRVLEVIFDTSLLTYRQDMLLSGLDVLLTATLIAGGSKGINTLTDRMQRMVSGEAKAGAAGNP